MFPCAEDSLSPHLSGALERPLSGKFRLGPERQELAEGSPRPVPVCRALGKRTFATLPGRNKVVRLQPAFRTARMPIGASPNAG